MKEYFNFVGSVILTASAYLLGGFDESLLVLITCIILDYFSGIFKSYIKANLSSKVGLKGILKKVGLLLIVVVGVMADKLLGSTGVVRNIVIYYISLNELLSILENLSQSGLKVPKQIKDKLKVMQESEQDESKV